MKCFGVSPPGFGKSLTCKGERCTYNYCVDCTHEFQQKIIKSAKINLLGYSTGGVMALLYAKKYPESVNKLIVFSAPYNGVEHFQEDIKKRPAMLKMYRLLERFPKVLELLNVGLFKKLMFRYFFYTYYTKRYPKIFEMKKEYIKRLMDDSSSVDARSAWELAQDIATIDFTNMARGVAAETLVIAPSEDEAVNPYWARKLASELLPHGQFYEVWGENHASGITEPVEISKKIIGFLK